MQRKAITEMKENMELQRRRQGDPVLYGQVIQLWHPYSQKYVMVDHTRTSDLKAEHCNLCISLCIKPYDGGWFRLTPRYKIRSEGEPVRDFDHVFVESQKIANQFFHSCKEPCPPESISKDIHELNLAVNKTSYSLTRFRSFAARVCVALLPHVCACQCTRVCVLVYACLCMRVCVPSTMLKCMSNCVQ